MARPKQNQQSIDLIIQTDDHEKLTPLKFDSLLQKAIESGAPLSKVQFHAAVNNSEGTPENYFSLTSANASRRCEMWLTTLGYVFKQNDKYFGCPTANGIFHNFI